VNIPMPGDKGEPKWRAVLRPADIIASSQLRYAHPQIIQPALQSLSQS